MYLTRRFYYLFIVAVVWFVIGYFWPTGVTVAQIVLGLLCLSVGVDSLLLYHRRGITAYRSCSDRFSNGDENRVSIRVDNSYPLTSFLEIIDEIPFVFQRRDVCFRLKLHRGEGKQVVYHLTPKERGVYGFGQVRILATSLIGLVARRYTCGTPQEVKVYPSFLMLHQYELLAATQNLTEFGIKKIRRVGHQTEFEQIKDYVKGDDYRRINWKASARRHELMVNVYQDERSQPIYCVIDKGRVMQQAFGGMTLLDYAINASLMLSYVAMRKEDKAGLVTFNEHFETFLPASKESGHLQTLLETLYKQQTTFGETDFSRLCIHLGKQLNKRGLLVLFTNFADMNALNRQLSYFQQLSRHHRLLVVFFEDDELNAYAERRAIDTEGYYRRVIAEKFVYEKRLMVSTLRQNGIHALLTSPNDLSVNVVNKYLEIKARQLI